MPKANANDYERIAEGSAEHAELVAKCQENWWLQYDGIPWQDDPYLEEYPYEFVRTESLSALQSFFQKGNYAVRQGILYHDLAFIQQDSGGDEWWTLKRSDEGWVAFESWSFGAVEWYQRRFSSVIASMRMATVHQCKHLEYGLPENDLLWEVGEAGACPWEGASASAIWCRAIGGDYELRIFEDAQSGLFRSEVLSSGGQEALHLHGGSADALSAACAAADWIREYQKSGKSELFRVRSQESAIERAAALRESAQALAADKEMKGTGRVR